MFTFHFDSGVLKIPRSILIISEFNPGKAMLNHELLTHHFCFNVYFQLSNQFESISSDYEVVIHPTRDERAIHDT